MNIPSICRTGRVTDVADPFPLMASLLDLLIIGGLDPLKGDLFSRKVIGSKSNLSNLSNLASSKLLRLSGGPGIESIRPLPPFCL